MQFLDHLLGIDRHDDDAPGLHQAIERAVARVEPLLKQAGGYPDHYRAPVAAALAHARALAANLPGPVEIDCDAYAADPFLRALFPSREFVLEAFSASQALRDYLREYPGFDEAYALMGMRRCEKVMLGMELSGEVIRRDVPQHVVFFSSHTIENLAPTAEQSREEISWRFFDTLLDKVVERVELRRQEKQSLLLHKDMLMARLHAATPADRPALEEQLASLVADLQATIDSLGLDKYSQDFAAVLLAPEQALRLEQTTLILDSMGVRREHDETNPGTAVVFNDLVGLDRRQWTVTLVHCRNLHSESIAARLTDAARRLVI